MANSTPHSPCDWPPWRWWIPSDPARQSTTAPRPRPSSRRRRGAQTRRAAWAPLLRVGLWCHLRPRRAVDPQVQPSTEADVPTNGATCPSPSPANAPSCSTPPQPRPTRQNPRACSFPARQVQHEPDSRSDSQSPTAGGRATWTCAPQRCSALPPGDAAHGRGRPTHSAGRASVGACCGSTSSRPLRPRRHPHPRRQTRSAPWRARATKHAT